jgi:glycosyltransferase involved in cell wall biosynthesis
MARWIDWTQTLTFNVIRSQMKLLVTGIDPPDEIGSWSGIPYHLCQALAKWFELCFVGGLGGPSTSMHKVIEAVYRRLGQPSYRIRSEPAVLKEFANRLQAAIDCEKPDAILSFSCEPIAYLKPGVPAFLIHDATFRLLSESYPHFQDLSKRSRKTGELAQVRGFERATAALASSEWARESACRDYNVPSSKVIVIPMGANLVDPPSKEEVAACIEERLSSRPIHFLFVGVEWGRKGGDSATAIVESLVRRGIDAKLHIVGCQPPPAVMAKPFVVAYGFLSKNNLSHAAKLRKLFQMARFFIVPSTAECFGCVFCEAEAFGIPCISRHTGGVSEVVKDGETGLLLSREISEEALAEEVFSLIENPPKYREMALRARADYEDRLNWDAYARRLHEIVVAESQKKEGHLV